MINHPALKVYIVGHTDNVGNRDINLPLSRARAEAVVAALLKDKSISTDRATAAGVGALSPVASNKTDAGRKITAAWSWLSADYSGLIRGPDLLAKASNKSRDAGCVFTMPATTASA